MTLFTGFAPVGFEVSGGGLIVIIVDEISEDGVEGFGFVSEGDIMASTFAFSRTPVGEEHDGDEVWEKGSDVGILDEFGNLCGEGEGEVFGSAAEELGVAEGAEGFVVSADDVLDGVLCAVFFEGKLGAAFFFAGVVADDLEFGGDVEFALVGGFYPRLGCLALVVDGAGKAFFWDIVGGLGHGLSSGGCGCCWRSGVIC